MKQTLQLLCSTACSGANRKNFIDHLPGDLEKTIFQSLFWS